MIAEPWEYAVLLQDLAVNLRLPVGMGPEPGSARTRLVFLMFASGSAPPCPGRRSPAAVLGDPYLLIWQWVSGIAGGLAGLVLVCRHLWPLGCYAAPVVDPKDFDCQHAFA